MCTYYKYIHNCGHTQYVFHDHCNECRIRQKKCPLGSSTARIKISINSGVLCEGCKEEREAQRKGEEERAARRG